ncbi:MAG: GIY-YIG nuclease family protein [Candidatus Paceibacterota bacterium]|jgi:putative endonuclease|nr:GIY-YIG nuclease family protein [bacterium]
MNSYFVYILSNKKNGVLYVGVTNDICRRIYEHKHKIVEGFSSKYNLSILVYYEETSSIESAIEKEKRLKKWNREWKVRLVEENNPEWRDLSRDF